VSSKSLIPKKSNAAWGDTPDQDSSLIDPSIHKDREFFACNPTKFLRFAELKITCPGKRQTARKADATGIRPTPLN